MTYFSINSPTSSFAERSEGPKAPKTEASLLDRALKVISVFGNVPKPSSESSSLIEKKPTEPKNLITTIEHGIEDSSYIDESGEEQFVKVYTTTMKKVDALGKVLKTTQQHINGTLNVPCRYNGAPL